MTERNFAKPGQPSDPQERSDKGHDGQPQPAQARPASPDETLVSTADDPADSDPLARAPLPKGDSEGQAIDADERLLKPLLKKSNTRPNGS